MASRLEVRHELGPRPERASARGFASTLTRDAPAAPATSLLTRVRERLIARRIADGRIGYGPSEYLEQIIDGGQVRVDE